MWFSPTVQLGWGRRAGRFWTCALGATLWGARPGLVSVVGDDYPADVLHALEQRGADLSGVRALGGSGVRTWLLYEGHVRRLIHRLECPTHEQVSPQPDLIPSDWSGAPAFHVAPMPFDVQRTLITSLRGRQRHFLSADPHLAVTEETLHDWREVLRHVDAFFPGQDELLLEGYRRIRNARCLASSAVVYASLSSNAVPAAESCTTRVPIAFTIGRRVQTSLSIQPVQETRSASGSCWRTSKDSPSTPACNAPSSRQASPSKAGERTRCSRRRAPMHMADCVGGMGARSRHEPTVHVPRPNRARLGRQ